MNLLRITEVETKTGLDRVTIWRLERSGKFPLRRQATGKSVRWIEREIDQWIEALPKTGMKEGAT